VRQVRRFSRKAVTEVILNPVFCGDNGDGEAQRALSAHRRGHNLLAGLQPKTRG
jgi:hypothetical protein